jgi:hypothetical protein
VVERHFIFQTSGHGSVEAQRFVQLMRRLEAFSGIRVLTYALMSNHFHLLCEVPEPKALSEAEVLERIEAGYGPACLETLQQELARYRQQPDGNAQIQRLLDGYRRRMCADPKDYRYCGYAEALGKGCPAGSIANTSLSKSKGAPRAQTNRRPLTWPLLSLSLNSRMGNFLCPNACFVGLGTSATG